VAVPDDQETVRSALTGRPLPPPAVDPWPDAAEQPWEPDPDATVAGEPSWEPGRALWTPAAPTSPVAHPVSAGWAVGSPDRPASSSWPSSAEAETLRTARPSSPSPVRGIRPTPVRPGAEPRPHVPLQVRRRSGGLLRFLRILLSAVVLIVAPLVALVLAYASRAGVPVSEAALDILRDIADLIRR
jgi:hypothetical protein